MSIAATRAYLTTPPPMRRAGDIVVEPAIGEVRSVAPTEPVQRHPPLTARIARPDAAFLAHLIATADQAPQTRELRRAAVAEVEAAYRTAAAYVATPAGRGRTGITV